MKTYQLENDFILLQFLDVGASITKLVKKANDTNYVIHYQDYDDYNENPYFLGGTIGRVAGRVFPPTYNNFKGQTVQLDVNEGRLHLHGGKYGFHKQNWIVEQTGELEYTLSYFDGSSFYEPMVFKIIYRLENNNFIIEYRARADVPSPCNITNHSYFNLNKDKRETVENHFLQTLPARIQVIDKEFIPTDVYDDMTRENDFFNFKTGKRVKEAFAKNTPLSTFCAEGIDLAYVFTEKGSPQIHLSSNDGENELKIYSNQESCVIYTLNKIDKEVLVNDGIPIQKYGGITFEMQRRPNYIHECEDSLTQDYFSNIRYEII